MRLTSILTAAVLAPLAIAAAPAAAATVSPAGVRFPQLAVNADGATVVTWERRTRGAFALEGRSGSSPRSLGPIQLLAPRGRGGFARAAIGADGTRAVQWVEFGDHGVRSLRIAVARPGHRFGRGQLLDRRRANVLPVGVAVQPNGRVVAIWQRTGSRLGFAIAGRNHAFGAAHDLAAIAGIAAGTIPVDARDGSVVVAYRTQPTMNPPVNSQAAVRTLSQSAATFSAPTILSGPPPATPFAEALPVHVSGPGGTGVAYSQVGDPYTLQLVRRAADGSWQQPERIAVADYGADTFPVGLRAALGSDGSAVAAWGIDHERPGGLGGSISNQTVAGIAGPSAPFGPAQALSPPAAHYGVPAVAAAGGEAFVATAAPHGPVLLATRSPGATAFATPRALTTRGDGDVLLAAAGTHVVAGYQRGDRLQLTVVR